MAAWLHRNEAELDHFLPVSTIPIAYTEGHLVLTLAPTDHLVWTETIAEWSENLERSTEEYLEARGLEVEFEELWVTGSVSDRFHEELTARGWKIRAEVRDLIRHTEEIEPLPDKVGFGLGGLDDDGLHGPPWDKVPLAYEFCMPDKAKRIRKVEAIDPSAHPSDSSSGNDSCGEGFVLFTGNTHQINHREILEKLAKLRWIKSIEMAGFD
jgi:hypothetical protein